MWASWFLWWLLVGASQGRLEPYLLSASICTVPEKTLLKTAAYMFDVHLGGISYVSRHIDHFFQFFSFISSRIPASLFKTSLVGLLCGAFRPHLEVEQAIAHFLGMEAAIT